MKKLVLMLSLAFALTGCADISEPFDVNPGEGISEIYENLVSDSLYVSEEEAFSAVNSLLGKSYDNRSRKAFNSEVEKIARDGKNLLYVINFFDEGGFAIISGVKNYYPIVAFSETGSFDIDGELPPAVSAWLTDMTNYLEKTITLPTDSVEKYHDIWSFIESSSKEVGYCKSSLPISRYNDTRLQSIFQDSIMSWSANRDYEIIWPYESLTGDEEYDQTLWENSKESIWPEYTEDWERFTVGLRGMEVDKSNFNYSNTIFTHWHQESPYNESFPYVGSDASNTKKAYAGCVNVALGQVMNYYKYPDTIEWSLFDDSEAGYSKISDFLYELSLLTNSKYEENETVAKLYDAEAALKHYGYKTKIMSDLSELTDYGYPYIIGSSFYLDDNGFEGAFHCWLLCGESEYQYYFRTAIWTFTDPYRINECWTENGAVMYQKMYKINWGWGENYDGWYSDAFPIPPSTGGYNQNRVLQILGVKL